MKRKRLLHEWHTFSDNLEVLMNILEEAENESKDSEDEEEEATHGNPPD
jgi:hypothetical protein